MNKKKLQEMLVSKKVAILLALLVMVGTFGTTLAYYNETQSLANPLKTGYSGAAILEEFNPDSSFLPGETVVKKVAFQNTGKTPIFLRVLTKPTEGWYLKEPNGSGGQIKAESLDTAEVIKGWTAAGIAFDTSKELSEVEAEADSDWQRMDDGYCYYKYILDSGEVTNEILKSIQLSTKVSNDRHDLDYSNKVYKLTFELEAIPVDEDYHGILEWNKKVEVKEVDGKLTLTWQNASEEDMTE